jgi:prefoldin subunit 5
VSITRDEFDAALGSINGNLQELQVQFRRIAQIQAELDELKQAVARLSAQR